METNPLLLDLDRVIARVGETDAKTLRKVREALHQEVAKDLPFSVEERRHLAVTSAVRSLLDVIEQGSATRPGLSETPERVAKAYREWFGGYHQNPDAVFKTFDDGAEGCNEMVVLENIPVYSHCEHHLAPWAGKATIAYIPNGRIVGLSKIPRLVEVFARRLQVQERLTNQVADAMVRGLQPLGVGVVVRAEHFCMATRGVHRPGIITTTSALRGLFLSDASVRAEFLALARG